MARIALRAAAILLFLSAIALASVSVSRVPTLSVKLTTFEGEPIPGAFVAYRYKGYRFNFVDSITYYRPGTTLRTDEAARLEIPGFLEFHPPLDTGLAPWIEWVYVPDLHHFFGPIGARSESRPGRIEIDRELGVFRFADLSDDPEGWSQTIRELDSVAHASHAEPAGGQPRYEMPDAIREALNAHLHREFRAFMERHARTPCAFPATPGFGSLSEEEQQSRRQEIHQRLEREPYWGQMMTRRWPELASP